MEQIISTLHTIFILATNGLLSLTYTAWEQKTALLAALAFAGFLWSAPTAQRPWIGGAGILAVLAAFLAPPPVPALLAGMALVGALCVRLDRFNPLALRWRVVGSLALYALAALGYLAYSRYLEGVDAAAWAQAIGGQQEAQTALAQGRAFLNTLATWGLWLILPLGYGSLLVQGLLVHPPMSQGPGETIAAVRTRGREGR